MVGTEDGGAKLHYPVLKVVGVGSALRGHGNHRLRGDANLHASVGVWLDFLLGGLRVGDMQSGLVQPVTPEAQTYQIAEKLLHDHIAMEHELVILDGDLSLLEDGDLVQGYIGREFILQSVYLDELLIQGLLVGMELVEQLSPMLDVLLIAIGHKVEIVVGMRDEVLHLGMGITVLSGQGDQLVGLEVP